MAGLSFFVPDDQTSGSEPWVRQMSHDFGPLGSWYGETKFQRQGTENGVLSVEYAHKMTYTPPAKDRRDLPFVITAAEFTPEVAGGTFQYDVLASRVQKVEERFVVKGTIAAEIAGQAIPVEVEEDQTITVRVFELNPWAK
jgi:hypothetical protein